MHDQCIAPGRMEAWTGKACETPKRTDERTEGWCESKTDLQITLVHSKGLVALEQVTDLLEVF